jgi:hypothetical protein
MARGRCPGETTKPGAAPHAATADPTALAMSRHGSLTLACRTVMQVIREIATPGAAELRRTQSRQTQSRG